MLITVITMYRGHDAEMFTQAVVGRIDENERSKWRKAHGCDEHFPNDEDMNNMFFRELEILPNGKTPTNLLNVDDV